MFCLLIVHFTSRLDAIGRVVYLAGFVHCWICTFTSPFQVHSNTLLHTLHPSFKGMACSLDPCLLGSEEYIDRLTYLEIVPVYSLQQRLLLNYHSGGSLVIVLQKVSPTTYFRLIVSLSSTSSLYFLYGTVVL